jgi:FkbM family methyltransferase
MLNLGPVTGTKVFIEAEILKKKILYINGYPRAIHMRRNTTDIKVFREIFLYKQYELPIESKIKVVLDAGANIGLSSVFFRNYFPHALIYSIEPDQTNFSMLLENISGYDNIIPIQSALWHNEGSLRVKNLNGDAWALEVEECLKGEPNSFTAITLSSLINQYHLHTIDLLKLDIEGSERELFSSGYEYWIPRTKHIIVEIHDWLKPGCSKAIFKAISQYSFKAQIFNGMLLLTNLELQ